MTATAPTQFTAAQIAVAIGMSKRHVLRTLGGNTAAAVPDDVRAWPLSALPSEWRGEIEARSARSVYRTPDEYLSREKPFQPCDDKDRPVPLAEIDPKTIAGAKQLQQALAPSLEREPDLSLSETEFWQLGCEDYQRVTGGTISERHFRRLFERTKEHAGSSEDFSRLEIYLPDMVKRAVVGEALRAPSCEPWLAPLREWIAALGLCPERSRHQAVWDEAFATYSEAVDTGGCVEAELRRQLLSLLAESAPYLLRADTAEPGEALRVNFTRKYQQWSTSRNLQAIEDKRLKRRESTPYEFTEAEKAHLQFLAITLDSTDAGWREFLASDKARPETKLRFERDPHLGRVRTPQWVRAWLDPIREYQQPRRRGPRTAKLNGAHRDRDPMTLDSGDADMSDDKTPDLYWWDDTPDGVWFGQGQFIPWIDERSWMIYGFALLSDDHYNGFDLRNSWTEKARKWGLPRKRIHVELGIWRSAKVFRGMAPQRNRWSEVGTEETEMGLRGLGIRFRHSTMPRGKLIERLFREHARFEQLLPGYCGSNQRLDRFEDVARKARLVKAGSEHPRDLGFMHRSQLAEHLNELIVKLNTTVRHGEYHKKQSGSRSLYLSPKEAYEEFFSDRLIFIPPQVEHLLRDNKIIKEVGDNGFQLEYGNRKFRYRDSDRLGWMKGQSVVVWFNPQDPSITTVTDLDGLNPFPVPLDPRTSHNASREEMARASASIANFESYSRSVHRTLAPVFKEEFQSRLFRYPVVESTTAALGNEMARQRTELKTQQATEAKQLRAGGNAAARLNMVLPRSALQRPEAARSLKRLQELLEDDGAEPKETT